MVLRVSQEDDKNPTGLLDLINIKFIDTWLQLMMVYLPKTLKKPKI